MSESLLSQIAAGRPQAVDDCMRRYRGVVWNLARRLLPSVEDAEDAVQEVFVELWKSAGRFDPAAGSELTFVRTIARRRFIDRGRRRTRRPQAESLPEPGALPAAESSDPVEVRDEAARVHEAMERLRPEHREVLEMSLLQGQSHQQVAERTGLPLGTVKSHARRGLMRVREMLGRPPDAPPETEKRSPAR